MAIKREDALILRGQREMRGGRMLSGKIWLELDGKHRIELTPEDAFDLAKKIFGCLDIELEYQYDQVRKQ